MADFMTYGLGILIH